MSNSWTCENKNLKEQEKIDFARNKINKILN